MENLRVLVIDDDPDILQTYRTILDSTTESDDLGDDLFSGEAVKRPRPRQRMGFEVTTVPQGLEGVEAASEAITQGSPYSLVFTDMRMPPGIDGLETARRILEIDPDIEVAIVTAYSDRSIQEMDHVLGENRFLLLKKPFDSDELVQMAQFLTFRWKLAKVSQAYERFVPKEFLNLLNKDSILEVRVGDHVERSMSILFSDIRSFTTLSEGLTPDENFRFLNSYLSLMVPVIREHHGIVDKYIGDSIMGIFDSCPEDAVAAAISMQKKLNTYNEGRRRAGYAPINIGVGVNTGDVMLGTIGDDFRMDGSVISDAVNLASRMESLTKLYRASVLISDNTFLALRDPTMYSMRIFDFLVVKGKSNPVCVFDIFDSDSPEVKEMKLATKTRFEEGLFLFLSKNFADARSILQEVLATNPKDKVVELYIRRCEHFERYGWVKGAQPHPFTSPLPL